MNYKTDLDSIKSLMAVLEANIDRPVSDRFLAQAALIPYANIAEIIATTSKIYPILESRGEFGRLNYQLDKRMPKPPIIGEDVVSDVNSKIKVLRLLSESPVPMTISHIARETKTSESTVRRFFIVLTNNDKTSPFIKAGNGNSNKYKPAVFVYADTEMKPEKILELYNEIPRKVKHSIIYSKKSQEKIKKTMDDPQYSKSDDGNWKTILDSFGKNIPTPKKNSRLKVDSVYPGVYNNVKLVDKPETITELKQEETIVCPANATMSDFIEHPELDSKSSNLAILKSLFEMNSADIAIESFKFKVGGLKFTVESD